MFINTALITPHVVEYRVASGQSVLSLAKNVNKCLEEGFVLYGQPFTGDGQLLQPMVIVDVTLKEETK